MNSKHQKTLQAVFAKPTSAAIEWRKTELLLVAVGSQCVEGEGEGDGSRVSFLMNNHRLDLHRPHPGKEAKRYQVKDVQSFLVLIGVKP
jgi:hypothetical protein